MLGRKSHLSVDSIWYINPDIFINKLQKHFINPPSVVLNKTRSLVRVEIARFELPRNYSSNVCSFLHVARS